MAIAMLFRSLPMIRNGEDSPGVPSKKRSHKERSRKGRAMQPSTWMQRSAYPYWSERSFRQGISAERGRDAASYGKATD